MCSLFLRIGVSAGEFGTGLDEVGGGIGFAADFATVAVLVGGFAVRAGAADEAIGKEGVSMGSKNCSTILRVVKPAVFTFHRRCWRVPD